MNVPFLSVDGDILRADAVAEDVDNVQRPTIDLEAVEILTDLIDVSTSIDKSTERHVAGDPVKRVNPQCRQRHGVASSIIFIALTAAP